MKPMNNYLIGNQSSYSQNNISPNINNNSYEYGKYYNLSDQLGTMKTAFTSFNEKKIPNNYFSDFENEKTYKAPYIPYNYESLNRSNLKINPNCQCHCHHFHLHHIHIPKQCFSDMSNSENNIKLSNQNDNLLKEVFDLRNECKKFREELDKKNNQNEEAKNNEELKDNNVNNNSDKLGNSQKYHDMLDKSFDVLNSVSKKCDDEKGKTRGGIYYYIDKENDYNQLINAQKNWIDNLNDNNKDTVILNINITEVNKIVLRI